MYSEFVHKVKTTVSEISGNDCTNVVLHNQGERTVLCKLEAIKHSKNARFFPVVKLTRDQV